MGYQPRFIDIVATVGLIVLLGGCKPQQIVSDDGNNDTATDAYECAACGTVITVNDAGECALLQQQCATDGDADTDADGDTDADTDADTDTDTEPSGAVYTLDDWTVSFTERMNPTGSDIGLFCDGCGTDDGWERAVAIFDEDRDVYSADVWAYGDGSAFRYAFGTVDDGYLTGWLDMSLLPADEYRYTFKECDDSGNIVEKYGLCVGWYASGSSFPGDCDGNYVPPDGCEAHDGGSDGGGDEDDGGSDGGSSGDLDREVCVTRSTSAYRLAYFDDGTPAADRVNWVSESGGTAVVNSPILTGSSGGTGCVTVTLTRAGATLEFNGYGSDSELWGDYLVGATGSGTYAYTSGSVSSEVVITVDGEATTVSDYNLTWTD